MSYPNPKIIVAMDFNSSESAMAFVNQVSPDLCRLKVGKELFVSAGPQFIQQVMQMGFEVFLDLKFHDIPNTVMKACHAAANLGVWMVNVHAFGGLQMLQAAREGIDTAKHQPLLIAVTVLTSMQQTDLQQIGIDAQPEQQVLKLAELVKRADLDGVVCSAKEAPLMKQQFGQDFCLVTPGIRLQNTDDDQKRTMTPIEAVQAGSDYLVIGRPVTQASDPRAVLEQIISTL